MLPAYRHIQVDCHGDVFSVRLRHTRLEEAEVHEFADELMDLVASHGCRKMLLHLGPESPQFLYSIFLAKLVAVRRNLIEREGVLKICAATPEVVSVFAACRLKDLFEFYPDEPGALASFQS